MGLYIYINKETREHREIFQGMNDVHEYYGENGDEDCWARVFLAPNAAIDTQIDPFSSNDFIRQTENKKETVGSMWDRSSELSEKRKDQTGGVDPVREKAFDKYEAERSGKIHPARQKEQLRKKLDKKGIGIEL